MDFYRTEGNRDSGFEGHNQNSAGTKTKRKGEVAPQGTKPRLPASVGGSPVTASVSRGSPQGQGTGSSNLGRIN